MSKIKNNIFLFCLIVWSVNVYSQWTSTSNYASTTTYNVDGAIISLSRNSTSNFDYLTYNFNDGTHQLNHADDDKTASVYGYDIADQAIDNYKYDASGNLISNKQDALSITYNSLGKIEKITKTTGEATVYTYNASGNKIKRINSSPSGDLTTTYYFLDALGNEINIYESTSSASEIKSLEASINGAEQEGSIANSSTTASTTSSTNIYTRTLGKKSFYHKDHLGSIRTTYTDNTKTESDRKVAVISCENTYPFGMAQPLRTYNASNTRKGFQGKEAENALASNKTVLDFGARYNDTKLGLWMSVDALDAKFPSLSPYNAMGNSPIRFIDKQGFYPDDPFFWDKHAESIHEQSDEEKANLAKFGLACVTAPYLISATTLAFESNLALRVLSWSATNTEKVSTIGGIAEGGILAATGVDLPTSPASEIESITANASRVGAKASQLAINKLSKAFTMAEGQEISKVGYILDYTIENGKIIFTDPEARASAFYDFVITITGELRIGGMHTYLSEGSETVLLAGRIYVTEDGVPAFTQNCSGHFRPIFTEYYENATILFKDLGIDFNNMKVYSTAGSSAYQMWGEIEKLGFNVYKFNMRANKLRNEIEK